VVIDSVAIEDDLRHLFQGGAFIGTRSIPFITRIWSNPKEMERVAGSDKQKCHFLINQLIGPVKVLNKNKRKLIPLQFLFSQHLTKMCHSCFIYIVLFGFELTS
jgi:hypothetical protein